MFVHLISFIIIIIILLKILCGFSLGLDSTLRSFSTEVDSMNKNLGQASYNRKVAKKKGIKYDPGKMPPIIDFASG